MQRQCSVKLSSSSDSCRGSVNPLSAGYRFIERLNEASVPFLYRHAILKQSKGHSSNTCQSGMTAVQSLIKNSMATSVCMTPSIGFLIVKTHVFFPTFFKGTNCSVTTPMLRRNAVSEMARREREFPGSVPQSFP